MYYLTPEGKHLDVLEMCDYIRYDFVQARTPADERRADILIQMCLAGDVSSTPLKLVLDRE